MPRQASVKVEWDAVGHVQEGPSSRGTSVHSVRFSRPQLAVVRAAAEKAGLTTSEFIREAAVARATAAANVAVPYVTFASPGATIVRCALETQASGRQPPALVIAAD